MKQVDIHHPDPRLNSTHTHSSASRDSTFVNSREVYNVQKSDIYYVAEKCGDSRVDMASVSRTA